MTVLNNTPPERVVRMDDFFAEQLEQTADIMPPSMAGKAAILRKRAMMYRASHCTKMLTIGYHWTEFSGDVEEATAASADEGLAQGLLIGQDEDRWGCGPQVTHGLFGAQNGGCDRASHRARQVDPSQQLGQSRSSRRPPSAL
jgi:hypothetical protein